jgi:hypothetical protein
MLGPGDFFGEDAWPGSASAWAARQPSPSIPLRHRADNTPPRRHSMSDASSHTCGATSNREDQIDRCSIQARSAWRARSCCLRAGEHDKPVARSRRCHRRPAGVGLNTTVAREYSEQVQAGFIKRRPGPAQDQLAASVILHD